MLKCFILSSLPCSYPFCRSAIRTSHYNFNVFIGVMEVMILSQQRSVLSHNTPIGDEIQWLLMLGCMFSSFSRVYNFNLAIGLHRISSERALLALHQAIAHTKVQTCRAHCMHSLMSCTSTQLMMQWNSMVMKYTGNRAPIARLHWQVQTLSQYVHLWEPFQCFLNEIVCWVYIRAINEPVQHLVSRLPHQSLTTPCTCTWYPVLLIQKKQCD